MNAPCATDETCCGKLRLLCAAPWSAVARHRLGTGAERGTAGAKLARTTRILPPRNAAFDHFTVAYWEANGEGGVEPPHSKVLRTFSPGAQRVLRTESPRVEVTGNGGLVVVS